MLNEEKGSEIKPIVFVAVGAAILMILYIIFGGKTDLSITGEKEPSAINIDALFSTIKDNYSIKVYETNSTGTTKWEYDREKDFTMYDLNMNTDYEKGYLVYKGKEFVFDSERNIYPSNDNVTSKDNFINLKLLRDVLKECEFKYVSDSSSECSIDTAKYIEKYNEYYNTDYKSDDSKTDMSIVYYSGEIHDIEVDYTNINKIINESDNKLKYKMTIININENDYSDIYNYYKDKIDN